MVQLLTQYLSPSLVEISGLVFLGYVFVYKPARLLLGWLRNNACSGCKSSRILKAAPNDWAAVTGSTDGIGLEYAHQLAEKGYNLLLLSRTEEKLKNVALEIGGKYPNLKIEYLAVDFTRTDIYESIKAKINSLNGQLYILVNNVGILHPIPELFADFPEGFNMKQINANAVSATEMTDIALKKMLSQKPSVDGKRPRGVIIFISSSAGLIEIPTFSVYGATKAYINYLGKVLSTEYASKDIIVQTVTPNQVVTKMSKELHEASVAVSAESFVRYSLKAVGSETMTNGHPKHKFINNALLSVTSWLCEKFVMRKMLESMLKKSQEIKEKNKVN